MTNSTAKIRLALIEEVPDILFFIKKLAVYEELLHEVSATQEQLAATLFGEQRNAEVVFAEVDGVKVGFALYFTSYSTFLSKAGIYLEDLFVLEEYRSNGYGKALLKYLAALVVERGYGRLEWSVLNWNRPSIEFYDSLGAEPMKEWTGYRLTGAKLNELAVSK